MSYIEIFVLALLQGLTEFLPISSSAHLIFPSKLLGWGEQGLAFDVTVHVGTLMAVLIYYRTDVKLMWFAWIDSFKSNSGKLQGHGLLSWSILLATIPAASMGYFGKEFIELHLRSLAVIAFTTILFGLLLGYADIKAKETIKLEDLGLKKAILIGLAQALALIPGTSRSGVTMTVGLMIGLKKDCAARFSFLLSIPIIAMAGGYISTKLIDLNEKIPVNDMLIGGAVAFISAYISIHYFVKLVNKVGMMPFVIYRLLLGLCLAAFITLY